VLDIEPEDFFNDFELASNESHLEFEKRLWGESEPLPLWIQEEMLEQEKQVQQNEVTTQQEQTKVEDTSKTDDKSKSDDSKISEQKKEEQTTDGKKEDAKTEVTKTEVNKDGEKKEETNKDETKKEGDGKSEVKTRFEITVPTNAELASNLKHHLFLVHGELDNNVHPANTLRLVDALIKANKKFDMLYLPATRHGFGAYQPYVTQRMFEFFADRLMTDYAEEKQPIQKK
jgi:hypothetical protein